MQLILAMLIIVSLRQLVVLPFQVLFELTCRCENGHFLKGRPYRFPWQREDWFFHVKSISSRVSNGFASTASDADALQQDSDSPSLQPNDRAEPSAPPADHRPVPPSTAESAWARYGSGVGGHRVSITDSMREPNFSSEPLRKPVVADDGVK